MPKEYVVVRGLNWAPPAKEGEPRDAEQRWEPGEIITATDLTVAIVAKLAKRGAIMSKDEWDELHADDDGGDDGDR